ncbi:MAG: DUF5320 domain-containing protein [Candidatus Aminicenantales bacterium]
MPAGDRTGPWGLGPMTGRSMGYCSGYPFPGFMNPGPGLGFGRGFWFGRGFGFGRGRGWRRGRFGRFWGYPYPPAMPYYGHPFGMPYGYPFPYSYGYPYPTAPGAGYPASSSTPGSGQKE